MDNDDTLKIIPLDVLESIIFDDDVYDDFINGRFDVSNDLKSYIKALNEYMDIVIVKSVGLSEKYFDRINTINSIYGGNRRFDYMDYLVSTQPIVTIYDIKKILNDEDTFNKFSDFNNNRELFTYDLYNYLAALDDYVKYFKDNLISLSSKEISNFNRIKLEYALQYKRMIMIKGEDVKISLAPKLEEELLSTVDLTKDKFSIARELYIELNKRCTYNIEFISYDQNLEVKKAKAIYDGVVTVEDGKYSIVCSTWSMIYAHLLNRVGIEAKINQKKGIHTFVDFIVDGTAMRADATNNFLGEEGLYMDDLVRCQLGLKTVGYTCLDPELDISYVLDKADENINYRHSSKKGIILGYVNEYREKYMSQKWTSITDKIKFLIESASRLPLDNLELFKYISILYENIFTIEEQRNINKRYVAINRKYAGFVVSYLNDDSEYEFAVFGKNYNKKYSAKKLNKLIDKGKIVPLGHNAKIVGLERKESDENDRRTKR